jgi:hypothetical protein
MPITEEKINKFKELLNLANSGLTRVEFTQSFQLLMDLIKKVISVLETKYQAAISNIETKFDELSKKFIDNAIEDFNKLKIQIDNKLAQVKDGEKGADGRDGISPDPALVAVLATKLTQERLLPQIPTIEQVLSNIPQAGEKIRDGLENLKGNERLEISAIKDLEEELEKIKKIKTTRQLFGGGGFSRLSLEQYILDPYVPTGTINGINTDFILSHTPNPMVSLKVYRNGQLQSITDDFTLNNVTITFLIAPVVGEIIKVEHRI